MTTNERTPSWRWADDGDTVTGVMTGVRQVESKFQPGKLVVVIDVDVPQVGVRSVWMESYGLRMFMENDAPEVGDRIVLQRTGKKPFTTKDGEERFMWEFHTERHRQGEQSSDLPFGDPVPPAPVEQTDDADIPF